MDHLDLVQAQMENTGPDADNIRLHLQQESISAISLYLIKINESQFKLFSKVESAKWLDVWSIETQKKCSLVSAGYICEESWKSHRN